MKIIKILLSIAFCILLMTATFAEDELRIIGLDDYMLEGSRVSLSCVNGDVPVSVTWSVNDTKLATITKAGVLAVRSAKIDRYVEVTATTDDGQAVTRAFYVVPKAESIRIYNGEQVCSTKELSINIDECTDLQLECKSRPTEALDGVKWYSSDESVAKVDADGHVTLLSSGRSTITVKGLCGRYTTCELLVYHNINSIEITGPLYVAVGEKIKATLLTDPAIAAGDPLEWKSEKAWRALVDNSGVIKGMKAGKTYISCESQNGVSAEIEIEVYAPVKTIRTDKYKRVIGLNTSEKIEFKISPINAMFPQLTFETDNPEIASVTEDGTVCGLSIGTTVLRAKAMGGASAEVIINVEYIPLESVAFANEHIAITVSESSKPNLVFTPANASTHDVVIEIDDESVAYLDENGCLVPRNAGKTTISVRPVGVEDVTDTAILRVISGNDKPLEGIKVGVNPGHQLHSNFTQLPVAPGSRRTKNANSGGAQGIVTKIREFEANLQISLKLREVLEDLGAEVVMTREVNEVELTNIDRAQMLNEANVDVALQMHNDSSEKREKHGSAVYTKSEDKVSQGIAKLIIKYMCDETGARNKGLKLYDLYMSLNWSETPAVLIECGYMTNADEDRRLADPEYQYKLALGIAKGLARYYGYNGDLPLINDYTQNLP